MISGITIRRYAAGEEAALWDVYFGAIHHVCIRHYTKEQVNAWAPDDFDSKTWLQCVERLNPFVAEIVDDQASVLAGYTDLQDDGLIDHFFVHHKYQRRGVASALMQRVLDDAADRGINRLYSHVSKTAQPLYKRFGFSIISENEPVIRGVALTNATMEKRLD